MSLFCSLVMFRQILHTSTRRSRRCPQHLGFNKTRLQLSSVAMALFSVFLSLYMWIASAQQTCATNAEQSLGSCYVIGCLCTKVDFLEVFIFELILSRFYRDMCTQED